MFFRFYLGSQTPPGEGIWSRLCVLPFVGRSTLKRSLQQPYFPVAAVFSQKRETLRRLKKKNLLNVKYNFQRKIIFLPNWHLLGWYILIPFNWRETFPPIYLFRGLTLSTGSTPSGGVCSVLDPESPDKLRTQCGERIQMLRENPTRAHSSAPGCAVPFWAVVFSRNCHSAPRGQGPLFTGAAGCGRGRPRKPLGGHPTNAPPGR